MEGVLETVKVVGGDGYIIINKSDLTDEHVLYGEDEKAEDKPRRGRPPNKKD